MPKVIGRHSTSEASRSRLSIGELIASLGAVGALAAAYMWASAHVLFNSYYGFFNAGRLVSATHEELVFTGALQQLENLIYAGLAVWVVWNLWQEVPRTSKLRSVILRERRYLLVILAIGIVYATMASLAQVEERGISRAREFAMNAERGEGLRAVVNGSGNFDAKGEVFRLACTDRWCLFYQPGPQKTSQDAKTASGKTVLLLLKEGDSVALTPSVSTVSPSSPDPGALTARQPEGPKN